jgi:hypothetical protein
MATFRAALVWLCLALVLFTSFAVAAPEHFALVLPIVWCLFVPALLLVIGRESTAAREQIASLRSLIAPRAPPLSRSFS